MKKYYFSLLSVIFVTALCVSFSSCGSDEDNPQTSDNTAIPSIIYTSKGYYDGLLYYTIKSDKNMEVAVMRSESYVTTVVIPSHVKIDNKVYTITSINEDAFSQRYYLRQVF